MSTRLLSVVGLILASWAHAQVITLPPQPVAPGSTMQVTLFNNTGGELGLPCGGSPLWMQHPDGTPIAYPGPYPCGFPFPQGTTVTDQFQVPATGPGSNGSFVFRSLAAAVRIDVGAPSASFPAIHANPYWISNTNLGHAVDYNGTSPSWEISNTSTSAHTFGAGDFLSIHAPGALVPLVSVGLAGITVPPQLSISGVLPMAGLPYSPLTVVMSWLDPGTNAVVTISHGINEGTDVDLRLKGGHVVPIGGSIPVELAIYSFPSLLPIDYGFCLGFLPGGSTQFGQHEIPLVLDALVMASLANGIGGLLVNNFGTAPPLLAKWEHGTISGITVHHHGIPGLSGVVVRAAAVAYEPVYGIFGTSQPELLIFQ